MNIVSDYIKRSIRRRMIPNSRYAEFPTFLGPLVMPTDWKYVGLMYRLYVRNEIYEPETVAYFQQHIRPTDVIIDIGANLGYYTVLFSKLAPSGLVFAFEPNPTSYNIMWQNTHQYPNVMQYKYALSNKSEKRRFFLNRGLGICGLTPKEGMSGYFLLQTEPLDAFDFQRVDFVKIDVEGHEGEVLDGMRKTIARNPNIRLVVEFKPERGLNDCFWDVLKDFEFRNLDHNVLAYRKEVES